MIIYSANVGIGCGMQKYPTVITTCRKQQITEGIELTNQENIRALGEKKTYKYLQILESDTIKQAEMKDKIKKEYLRRTRKLIKTNYIKEILSKG